MSVANTYTGSTTVSSGTLVLGTSGSIASTTLGFGVTNTTSGVLAANNSAFAFTGTISLNLASVTVGSQTWNLFGGTQFGPGDLDLADVTSNLGGLTFTQTLNVWSGTDLSSRTWSFTESTGVLSVVPEPGTFAMLLAAFGMLLGFQRTRRHAIKK